jgi:hypothetical protein
MVRPSLSAKVAPHLAPQGSGLRSRLRSQNPYSGRVSSANLTPSKEKGVRSHLAELGSASSVLYIRLQFAELSRATAPDASRSPLEP